MSRKTQRNRAETAIFILAENKQPEAFKLQ